MLRGRNPPRPNTDSCVGEWDPEEKVPDRCCSAVIVQAWEEGDNIETSCKGGCKEVNILFLCLQPAKLFNIYTRI